MSKVKASFGTLPCCDVSSVSPGVSPGVSHVIIFRQTCALTPNIHFPHRPRVSFENEALENEDRSTKNPNLENEAPKTRKRSTQISKTEHPRLENEAPKSRKRSTLKDLQL